MRREGKNNPVYTGYTHTTLPPISYMVPTRVSHTSTCHTTKHIHHYTYYLRAPSGTESVNTHTYLAGETLSSYIGASSEPSIPRWSLSFFYDQTEKREPSSSHVT